MEDYKEKKAEYDKARRNGGDCEMPIEPDEPHERRLVVNEMSMEGLAERILAHNERGVMILYQELMGFIGGFDAYKSNGVKKDRQAALELFDGGRRNRDLVRGTVWVPNWSACIIGGIQTDKLRAAAHLSDDGLLQRFLLVEVNSSGIGEDRKPNTDAISDYDAESGSLPIDPITLRRPDHLVTGGSRISAAKSDRLAFALKEEPTLSAAFRGHANKLNGIFARLLLTLHLIETPHRRTDLLPVVSGATARRAHDLMVKYLIPHALNIYSLFFGEGASDAKWVAGYILAHDTDTAKLRDTEAGEQDVQKYPQPIARGDGYPRRIQSGLSRSGNRAPAERPNGGSIRRYTCAMPSAPHLEKKARDAAGLKAVARRKIMQDAFA